MMNMKKFITLATVALSLSVNFSYSATSTADAAGALEDPINGIQAKIGVIDPIIEQIEEKFFKADKKTVRDDLVSGGNLTGQAENDLMEILELITNANI